MEVVNHLWNGETVTNGTVKHAAALDPGDEVTLHGQKQTVVRTQRWLSGDTAVFTDVTGDDPWLLSPAQAVTVYRHAEEAQ